MQVIDQLPMSIVPLRDRSRLRGAGFLVRLGQRGPNYVVTARHLLEGVRGPLRASVSGRNRSPVDIQIPRRDWWESNDPAADVAVATLAPGDLDSDVDALAVMASSIADEAMLRAVEAGAGDEVVSPALVPIAEGNDRRRGVLRFARIAAMNQLPWQQRWSARVTAPVDAILLDAPAWAGHDGAPVFLVVPASRRAPAGRAELRFAEPFDRGDGVDTPGRFVLLGVVSGRWNSPSDHAGDDPAAGMVLVTPARQILDLLHRDDVVADRSGGRKSASVAPSREDFVKLLRRAATPTVTGFS